jgi:hypothetical protein
MTEWKSSEAKKFAKQVKLGKTYYTVREQTAHAAIYNGGRHYSEHVFTGHSVATGQPMTDGRTSALALCRNQGPVYDTKPSDVPPSAGPSRQDGEGAFKAGGKARGWW